MQDAWILIEQTLVMFLLAGVGAILFRTGKITTEGSKSLGNLLIYLVLPVVIINGFRVECTREKVIGLLVSAILAAVSLLICMAVSHLFFRHDAVAGFGAAFSNPGFFGIPLMSALLTDGAVFYVAAYIGMLNLLQFTYGVALMKGGKVQIRMREIVRAPFFLAILIGCVLFFTQLPLPAIVGTAMQYISAVNTPLAMFVVGVYLAQTNLCDMFRQLQLYRIALVRLVVIPFVILLFLAFVPTEYQVIKTAVFIAAACPVGSNVAVYAQLHGKDYLYAVKTVVLSTILSIITIPLLMYVADYIM